VKRRPPTPPDAVHIVVVAYDHAEALDSALAPVAGDFPVTVVDNSSSDQVAAVARRHGADYLDPGSNRGFGAGVNVALQHLQGVPPTSVLLLNPDAVIRSEDVRALLVHSHSSPKLAAVAPRLTHSDGSDERVSWPFPSPWRAWLEAFGVGRFLRTGRQFVIGAVLLLDWNAIEEIGAFDERFFLYCEETDWQRRAADADWRSAVCMDAVAEHTGAGTSDDPARREALFHAAHEIYIRKWFGTSGWWAYRAAASFGAVARAVVLRGERRSLARRRAAIYVRGPRRCAEDLVTE
jgi:GT2 family glycosyltransferase